MKLEKAIELGKEAEKSLRVHKFSDHADAIKMLIGAGELHLALGMDPVYTVILPLPGETEE